MNGKPTYLEIVDVLDSQIERLAPNSLLPTEHQLAKRFGVSRVTVRRALDFVERSGRVSRQRGRGTLISPPKITRRIVPTCPIEQDLKEQGLKLETEMLAYEPSLRPPEPIRARLALGPADTAGCLSLIRVVDDRVICHDRRYFPPAISARFDPQLVADRPISELVQELAGRPMSVVDWETEITPAPQDVARPLGITPGVLVVMSTFTAHLESGEPVEAGVMSYRIDRVKFRVVASGPLLTVGPSSREDIRLEGQDSPAPAG
jgi:GntR family transcriptional regulator